MRRLLWRQNGFLAFASCNLRLPRRPALYLYLYLYYICICICIIFVFVFVHICRTIDFHDLLVAIYTRHTSRPLTNQTSWFQLIFVVVISVFVSVFASVFVFVFKITFISVFVLVFIFFSALAGQSLTNPTNWFQLIFVVVIWGTRVLRREGYNSKL